ncbi:polysaccharide biosynthesis/export family protein [Bythopirellula goksoeyrii]|uniref:Polysaccharide biosynthesis/export protein n=1 Tax=Bythopirellula goksoeyrii TaxID=1400387 RepID=A0A5B9QEF9_9BACT|nr:polysaccharide biosynthesis/export family protein [Bythopirellula goksoeyrii]QEG36020.1 Polysaccharide biosynthesis/export protein [Bythopirellula goksoeyrii]
MLEQTNTSSQISHRIWCGWLLLLLVASSGCRVIYPGRLPDGPQPCIPANVPREQAKVTLPDYLIEPPDILRIEAISLVPKAPYQLRVFDVLSISTTGLTQSEAIDGEYTIQPDGSIKLGHEIGAIQAGGLTSEQLQEQILAKLKEIYTDPTVWVTLVQIGAQQQVAGEHLVAPDGKVNLGHYGRVRVVGLSIEEAQATVQAHLSQYLEDPQISLDVLGYNSKVYYVITQGAGLGDQVAILPARGNETVLDAIGQIQGLQSNSSTRMWIARPGYNEQGGDQILPVDWLAVTQRGDIETNYQIMPGDRVYVSEDKLVAMDTAFGKLFSPFERIFGVTLLGTQTAQRIVFFNQPNQGFGGF